MYVLWKQFEDASTVTLYFGHLTVEEIQNLQLRKHILREKGCEYLLQIGNCKTNQWLQ